MKKEEFAEKLMEFFNWTGDRERTEMIWFISLEEWISAEYNRLSVERLKGK